MNLKNLMAALMVATMSLVLAPTAAATTEDCPGVPTDKGALLPGVPGSGSLSSTNTEDIFDLAAVTSLEKVTASDEDEVRIKVWKQDPNAPEDCTVLVAYGDNVAEFDFGSLNAGEGRYFVGIMLDTGVSSASYTIERGPA